jgi:hypothetical protein
MNPFDKDKVYVVGRKKTTLLNYRFVIKSILEGRGFLSRLSKSPR